MFSLMVEHIGRLREDSILSLLHSHFSDTGRGINFGGMLAFSWPTQTKATTRRH